MRRQDHSGVGTLTAELIDDVRRLTPVRVDQRLLDFEDAPVLSLPLAPEAFIGQRGQRGVQGPLEARLREERLNARIRIGKRIFMPVLIRP